MTWIDWIFFIYIFIGLYMFSLFIFLYNSARQKMFAYPPSTPQPVSIIVPCYNEGKNVAATIQALQNLDYPKNMLEIIIVDDHSSDDSVSIIRNHIKKYGNVRLIVNKRNSGGAAEPTNIGIKAAKYPFIAVADADSTPQPDALRKMIGFLQTDPRVGGVTCAVLAKQPTTFMQKLQEIEYVLIAFNRKLLDLIDAVYVTPGPFALYRKKVLLEIGLFDPKNLTQDIEIVWKMLAHGYKARMCLATAVYSTTPQKFSKWWRQRIRWNLGGTQCILKYKQLVFKKGMLGAFIIPFFSISLFIGLFGLFLFIYLLARRFITTYLSTTYSLYANTVIARFDELSFSPSVLNYFGFALFFLGLYFTFFVLGNMRKMHQFSTTNIFNTLVYIIVYLSIYPFIMITALYKLLRGKYAW